MFFSKIKEGLNKTKEALNDKLNSVFNSNKELNEMIEDIEEVLVLSDLGMDTAVSICDNMHSIIKKDKDKSEENIKKVLKEEMIKILDKHKKVEEVKGKQVILVVGINGVGKTTSIGKITNLLKKQGKDTLLVAADTFRAGAIEQLNIWAKRCNSDIILGKEGSDPSSVIFEGVTKFKDSNKDILICDTAGRLHNKKNLMDELEKMRKTIDKVMPDVSVKVYMVLDSTTGQNAISQVKSFYEKTSIDSIILTKLDSTAKGGIIFNIVNDLDVEVKYIGTGEQIDDIEEFDSKSFVDNII